ncbi:hypothetical protein GOB93_03145 [Acetobacter musti]|uniref:Uncharacterized protein n=1 Tax=Acetobacter musti TaxID=864732 RepID=A0ABX0JLV6_9PROT|nr:hypothetical protein [Acetobacter musti]NHN83635.1 hypothetical protein [Acetobacter musti]
MPRYHLSLKPTDSGSYAAVLMDMLYGWPIRFDRCSKARIDGKSEISGDSTGGLPNWRLTVSPVGSGLFQAVAEEDREWRIFFPECELQQENGESLLEGWAEDAEPIETREGIAA